MRSLHLRRLCVLALTGSSMLAHGTPAKLDYTPVQLTISGGVSLGNYEAGLNWALLRIIKRNQNQSLVTGLPPLKLVSVSGASAGNINAFVTAVEWCKVDSPADNVEKNLFWESWIPIGWERLFAGELSCHDYEQKLEELDAAMGIPHSPITCSNNGSAYLPDDGVLTRRAFQSVEAGLRSQIERGSFDPSCKIAVGVTTTKVSPAEMEIGVPPAPAKPTDPDHCYESAPVAAHDNSLTIQTQRFVTALKAESRNGKFGFHEHAFCEDRSLGKYLHLPTDPGSDERVPVEHVLSLTEASSAFPVAFGPKKLHYCEPSANPEQAPAGMKCGANETLNSDYFVDGGVFDNVPLGLGDSLLNNMLGANADSKRYFFYIDPERRRYLSPPPASAGSTSAKGSTPANKAARIRPGIHHLVGLLNNSVNVGMKYELQTVARYVWPSTGQKNKSVLNVASRLSPITGKYMSAFSAFFATAFRKFDYYAGVYDGSYAMAQWICDQQRKLAMEQGQLPNESQPRCVFNQMKKVYADLGLDQPAGQDAAYLFHVLLQRELDAWQSLDKNPEPELATVIADAKAWGASTGFDPKKPASGNDALAALARTVGELHAQELAAAKGDAKAAEWVADYKEDFAHFLDVLRKDDLTNSKSFSEDEQELLGSPDAFATRTMLDVVARARKIELADQQHLKDTSRSLPLETQVAGRALAATQLVLISQSADRVLGMEWDPSSAPNTIGGPWSGVTHFLPYRLSWNFGTRALEGAWEPTLGLHSHWALIFPETLSYEPSNQRLVGGLATGLLFRVHNGWFSGVDLSLRPLTFDLVGSRPEPRDQLFVGTYFQPGLELGLRGLGGKIRLSVGVDDVRNNWTPMLKLGLVDFNGTLYWLGRVAGGG